MSTFLDRIRQVPRLTVSAFVVCASLAHACKAAPPAPAPEPDSAEVQRLRKNAEDALTGLHTAATTAQSNRDAARKQADQFDAENQQLRTRVAQLEATTRSAVPTGGKVLTVQPGNSIQATLDTAKPGDVVVVSPGEFSQNIRVPRGVVLSLNGVTMNGEGKLKSPAVVIGQSATLVGGTISGFLGGNERQKAAVILFGDDATLEGVTITNVEGAAIGANEVQRPRIVNNIVRDVTGSWIMFGGGEKLESHDAFISGNTIERWNTAKFVVKSGPGVNKFTRVVNGVFTNNTFKDGFGPALWGDIGNRKFTITNNTFDGIAPSREGWDAIGIYIEISNGEGSVIENNTFTNIDRKGSAICIAESNGVMIRHNTVDRSRIEFRDVRDPGNQAKARGFWTAYNGQPRTFTRAGIRDITTQNNILLNGAKADHLSVGSWDGDSAQYFKTNNIVWKDNVAK